MKKVVRHIEFLLMTHECVIIPGLGAVLSHCSEAAYDAARGVWTPPTRAFAFNPELTHNDGLLAASIARRDRVSLTVANGLIADAVAVMRRALETEGSVSLGAAGTLTLQDDGLLSFIPGDTVLLSPSLMWLPAVETPVVARASQLERSFGAELSRRMRVERALRRAGGWAACITLLVLAGWLVSRNIGLNPGAQFASIFPIDKVAEPVDTPVDDAPVVLILASAPADEDIENVLPKPEVKQPLVSDNHPYCLVVASCTTMAEAESYVNRSTDLPLGIVENNGRWRVYAATGATANEALAAGDVEPIASRYPSRWVCRR